MFLTVDEIVRLTGFKRKEKQCAQLDKMYIPYRKNARGEPIVSASFIEGIKEPQTKTRWHSNLKVA